MEERLVLIALREALSVNGVGSKVAEEVVTDFLDFYDDHFNRARQ